MVHDRRFGLAGWVLGIAVAWGAWGCGRDEPSASEPASDCACESIGLKCCLAARACVPVDDPCPTPVLRPDASIEPAAPIACPAEHAVCGNPAHPVCAHLATDDANCGACGRDCLGSGCANGRCVPVTIANEPLMGAIAVDEQSLFMVAGRAVKRVPLGSCAAGSCTTVVSYFTGTVEPPLAVDDQLVYWRSSTPRAGIYAQGKDAPLASIERAIAVDDAERYYTATAVAPFGGAVYFTSDDGSVSRVERDGTGQRILIPAPVVPRPFQPSRSARSLTADRHGLVWAEWGVNVPSPPPSDIKTAALDGTGVSVLVPGLMGVWRLAVDDDSVFYATGTRIDRVPRSGGTPVHVYDTREHLPLDALTVSGDWVYYSWFGAIGKVRTDGSDNRILVVDDPGSRRPTIDIVRQLVVAGDWLYWAEDGGAVRAVPK